MATSVTFVNKPILSGDSVDRQRDVLRLELVPAIEDFIDKNPLFKGEKFIEFSDKGISSVVCFVSDDTGKYVLKIPLNKSISAKREALFLNKWAEVGILTPSVYETGEIAGCEYLLMNYIKALTIEEDVQRGLIDSSSAYFKAGEILHTMHMQKATGFGSFVNGQGEFKTFTEWLNSDDMRNREKYIKDNSILDSSCGSYEKVKEILVDYVGIEESSYCHFDFSCGHLFATNPPTVFDPNPALNHGCIDLGRTLVNYTGASGGYPKDIVRGYFMDKEIDQKILHSAVYVNIVYKLPYQHQKGRTEIIERFTQYLKLHSNLLD